MSGSCKEVWARRHPERVLLSNELTLKGLREAGWQMFDSCQATKPRWYARYDRLKSILFSSKGPCKKGLLYLVMDGDKLLEHKIKFIGYVICQRVTTYYTQVPWGIVRCLRFAPFLLVSSKEIAYYKWALRELVRLGVIV